METPTQKIKKLMIDHNVGSIAKLAREFEQANPGRSCSREQMSMCINCIPGREYPEFRAFIAKKFNRTVRQLFGAEVAKAA